MFAQGSLTTSGTLCKGLCWGKKGRIRKIN